MEPTITAATIRLAIPATPEYIRLARLAAADIGARSGFDYEELDDLRIAVDELCFAIIGAGAASTTLELEFTLLADGITIEGSCENDAAPDPNELSRAIVGAVVDEHELSGADGTSRFRMLKRPGS